jgi:hypothetical protein
MYDINEWKWNGHCASKMQPNCPKQLRDKDLCAGKILGNLKTWVKLEEANCLKGNVGR